MATGCSGTQTPPREATTVEMPPQHPTAQGAKGIDSAILPETINDPEAPQVFLIGDSPVRVQYLTHCGDHLSHVSKTEYYSTIAEYERVAKTRTNNSHGTDQCTTIPIIHCKPSPIVQKINEGDLVEVEALARENPKAMSEVDRCGKVPLNRAIRSGQFPIAEWLMENGADVNLFSESDLNLEKYETAIWLIMEIQDQQKRKELLGLAIKKGGNLNQPDEGGRTVLMARAYEGDFEGVKLLIQSGAGKTIKGHDGRTARDWAIRQGHLKIAEYLK